MSGLEVAGVVLGALPLVISALEHYAKGVNTAKRFWMYKIELRTLILQINTERSIFTNTVEQLFTGIVRIEQMSDFVTSAGSQVWQEQDINDKLKERLRGTYDVYLENVKGMGTALRRIMEKLALDPEGKPQFTDPSLFKQEYKRLKFSLSRAEYSEQIGNLRNFNQSLLRLTKQSLELESTRSTRRSGCPNFQALQAYVRSLYEILRSGLNCASGCQGHAVKLRLESRTSRSWDGDEIPEEKPFRIVFTHALKTHWQEADIRCIIDKPKSLPLHSSASKTHPAQKKVRFGQLNTSAQTHPSQSVTMTVMQSPSTLVPHTSPAHIQDLCKAFQKLQPPQKDICMGYLLDAVQRKYGVYPLLGPHSCGQQQWTAFTLRQIFTGQAVTCRRLTQHDKLRVALDLSSSVLQLYKTPWLDEDWGGNDVFFVQKPGAHPVTMYDHPYVYRQLTLPNNASSPPQQPKCRVIRNQTLYSLGILLIELWYGQSIEKLQIPPDLDCAGTPGVAWCTAERLVENELEFEAGKRYSDAVRRCIRCDFDRSDMNLDSEDFQQAVFEGVVVPLETTLEQFGGKL